MEHACHAVDAVLHSDGMVETVHEATTPQRTGGQRQRSGEWSTSLGQTARTGRRTVAARGGAACGLLGQQREAHGEEGRGDQPLQEDVDTLRGPGRSDDGLADDVRQHSHPGWVAHGVVVSTPREVVTCAGEVGAGTLRAVQRVR